MKSVDIYAENVRNQNFDIDEYIKLESDGKVSLSVIILVDRKTPDKLNYEEEYQKLHDTIQRISEENNIFVSVCLKFVTEEIYSKCVDYLEKTSYARNTFDELVGDYPVKVTGTDMDFRFDFQGDTSITITKEEYINQRKEVN